MTVAYHFRQEQRSVALRMAAALSVTLLVSTMCLYQSAVPPLTLAERLIATARADVFVLCWLAVAIGNVARLRFLSADDIAGSGVGSATAEVGRARAVLQNTLEQAVLALPVHVALAVLVASSAPLIVALAALFTIGRLFFWTGYARGPKSRAFGFALTFYSSLTGLVIAVFSAVGMPL